MTLRARCGLDAAALRPISMMRRMNSNNDSAPTEQDLQDLVARAQGGDHEAFADLMARHHTRLRTLVHRIVRRPDQVDDVLQEAYLKAFRSIRRFRGEAGVATWLHRITYNACLDELRRRPFALTGTEDVERASTTAGPAETAVAKVEVAEVLARLGPELAATVVLVHGYGLDYAAASNALGVPEGTIASRLNRARARARAQRPVEVAAHAA